VNVETITNIHKLCKINILQQPFLIVGTASVSVELLNMEYTVVQLWPIHARCHHKHYLNYWSWYWISSGESAGYNFRETAENMSTGVGLYCIHCNVHQATST